MKKIMNFFKEEDGAAIPEYALILGVVAAVAIAVLLGIGQNAASIFGTVNTQMNTAVTTVGS